MKKSGKNEPKTFNGNLFGKKKFFSNEARKELEEFYEPESIKEVEKLFSNRSKVEIIETFRKWIIP